MSLAAYALTTLDRTKIFLGITNVSYNNILTTLINNASDFIERFCDRRFKKTAYSNQVYDGNGTNRLLLKQYPVVSGEIFTLQERDAVDNTDLWDTIDTEDYFVKNNEGIIEYVCGEFLNLPQHYRISYMAGYDYDNAATFLEDCGAGDLEYACWKIVGKFFANRKGSSEIQSERIGDYSVTYSKIAREDPEIARILEKYLRPF